MHFSAVLFDFDGTLVDSSPGVLASLSAAFELSNYSPGHPLASVLIGPPLRETLRFLSPNSSPEVLDRIASNFKAHYDSVGFQHTNPFPGVEHMLQLLANANIRLHIATNKRQRPTSQILDALGWTSMFELVISPDSFIPPMPSKTAILNRLLAEANLDAKNCLYIGDRFDDYNAALEADIPFGLAEWGFEGDSSDFPANIIRLQAPDAGQIISLFDDKTNH